jgi:hypothetical protein
MTRGRIVYDAPRAPRWGPLAAMAATLSVVAAVWWPSPNDAPRAAAAVDSHGASGGLPAEIGSDPFGVRNWPSGNVPADAVPPVDALHDRAVVARTDRRPQARAPIASPLPAMPRVEEDPDAADQD